MGKSRLPLTTLAETDVRTLASFLAVSVSLCPKRFERLLASTYPLIPSRATLQESIVRGGGFRLILFDQA